MNRKLMYGLTETYNMHAKLIIDTHSVDQLNCATPKCKKETSFKASMILNKVVQCTADKETFYLLQLPLQSQLPGLIDH